MIELQRILKENCETCKSGQNMLDWVCLFLFMQVSLLWVYLTRPICLSEPSWSNFRLELVRLYWQTLFPPLVCLFTCPLMASFPGPQSFISLFLASLHPLASNPPLENNLTWSVTWMATWGLLVSLAVPSHPQIRFSGCLSCPAFSRPPGLLISLRQGQ